MKKVLIIIAIELIILASLGVYSVVINKNNVSENDRTVEKVDTSVENTQTVKPTTSKQTIKPVATAKPEVHSSDKNEENTSIRLSFTGDILLDQKMDKTYEKADNNIDSIISNDLVKYLNESDLFMANEEFPFSIRGTKAPDKQYTFRVNPSFVSVFGKLGLDIVSLANNHALDYGTDALVDTIDTLDDSDIKHVGAGKNKEQACKVEYIEVTGKKIAIMAASRVIPVASWNAGDNKPGMLTTYDPTILLSMIEEAKKKSDIVVVYVHWGVERSTTPEDFQYSLAKKYIDAGADAVIGAHTHCLQGVDYYKGKPIAYSLGNFIFGYSIKSTMIFNLNIDNSNEISVDVIPCKSDAFRTTRITDKGELKKFYNELSSMSENVKISEEGIITPKNSL